MKSGNGFVLITCKRNPTYKDLGLVLGIENWDSGLSKYILIISKPIKYLDMFLGLFRINIQSHSGFSGLIFELRSEIDKSPEQPECRLY